MSRLWDGHSSANELAESRGEFERGDGSRYLPTRPYSAETLAFADKLLADARALNCPHCAAEGCNVCINRVMDLREAA